MILEDDIRCILAPNPSPMTFHGTNTYILGQGEVCIIDPGPISNAHLQAILDALGPDENVAAILCTHAHLDHTPLAARLSGKVNAPVYAFGTALSGESPSMAALRASGALGGGEGIDHAFQPDITLADGEVLEIGQLKLHAIWTPGHLSNHLCFREGDRVFSGDHVMDWATSMISPPDGDLNAFMASLRKLQATPSRVLYPAHGGPVLAPGVRLKELYDHRLKREAQILDALAISSGTAAELAARIYTEVPETLLPAATRNVLAHLIALADQGRAHHTGTLRADTAFKLS